MTARPVFQAGPAGGAGRAGRAGAAAPGADPAFDATVYTDGGASPNPGPGGWAAVILRPGEAPVELSGGEDRTTNNRMELTAAIRALEALHPGDRVRLFTDSQYLRQGVTRWLAGWIARGWKRAGGGAVENEDLWRRLHALVGGRRVEWSWVRGHAGNHWNERADELASAEIRRHRKQRAAAAPAPAETVDYEVCLRVSAGGGTGGWAALVRGGGDERQVSGARRGASANQMDVAAAAEVLESLPAGTRVAFHTASDYLRNGARSWLPAWRRRGWKTKDGRPVANRELWERLERAMAGREVVWPPAEQAPPELAALDRPAREARSGA